MLNKNGPVGKQCRVSDLEDSIFQMSVFQIPARFFQIIKIMCFFRSPQNRKASVQIRVAGSQDLLVITCPSLSVAENLADLIDGYCRLVNNSSTSIWSRKGKQTR